MDKQHTFRVTGGTVHANDCEPCSIEAQERQDRKAATNPHRVGTKAHAERERIDGAGNLACDPRSETYWSM